MKAEKVLDEQVRALASVPDSAPLLVEVLSTLETLLNQA